MKLISVKLDGTCENKKVTTRKQYLIKYEGKFYAGKFEKQWYGWNFNGVYDAGLQLDSIDKVWEIKQN